MNIIDNGAVYTGIQPSAPASAQAPQAAPSDMANEVPAAPERQDVYIHRQTAENALGAGLTVGRETGREARQTRDEFVQTPVPVHDAIYNVYDVRSNRQGQARRSSPSQTTIHGDRRETEKIADILLAMGRKGLAIFRLSDQSEGETVRRTV